MVEELWNERERKQRQLQRNLYEAALALLEFEGAQSARLKIQGTDPPVVIVITPEKYLHLMLT